MRSEMPVYEFKCENCGEVSRKKMSYTEVKEVAECDSCGYTAKRVWGCNFVLKGDNWPGQDLRRKPGKSEKSKEVDKVVED